MSSNNDGVQNNLTARLHERIKREGPISFHEWMQAALYDPQDGYYCRSGLMRQGRTGDYRTAPETSPLFAATFTQYFLKSYLDLGAPRQWAIIEAGAGAGHFARGVLSTLRSNAPEVFAATRYLIDEVGPDARANARDQLAQFGERVQFCRLQEIAAPFECAIIFSNELIDAFPVYRVIGRGGGLKELCVGLNEVNDFIWVEGDLSDAISQACARLGLRLGDGQIFELNLATEEFVSRASSSLDRGFLITVDYGASRDELLNAPHRYKGTLRSFHKHQFVDDVLAAPGTQDLTTTVDWTEIEDCGVRHGFRNIQLERLDRFLLAEGLLETLSSMSERMTHPADRINLATGAREMVRPDGLAASFQVLIQRKGK